MRNADPFDPWTQRYAHMVRAWCTRYLAAEDLDDAVQDVFLRTYRSLGRLRDPARMPGYLRRVARNLCVDQLRRRAPRPLPLHQLAYEPAMAQPGEQDLRQQRIDQLEDEVRRLSPTRREVVHLFYFERKSHAEIAHELGMTLAAVNQRLSRARRQLREAVGKAG